MPIPNPLEALGELASSALDSAADIAPSLPDVTPTIDAIDGTSFGSSASGSTPAGVSFDSHPGGSTYIGQEPGSLLVDQSTDPLDSAETHSASYNFFLALGQTALVHYVDTAVITWSHRRKRNPGPFDVPGVNY